MEIFAMANDLVLVPGQGLNGVWENIKNNWIGPILIAIIAVVALILLWQRKIMAFAGFAVVAILASVFVFGGDALFGDGGSLNQTGQNLAGEISN